MFILVSAAIAMIWLVLLAVKLIPAHEKLRNPTDR